MSAGQPNLISGLDALQLSYTVIDMESRSPLPKREGASGIGSNPVGWHDETHDLHLKILAGVPETTFRLPQSQLLSCSQYFRHLQEEHHSTKQPTPFHCQEFKLPTIRPIVFKEFEKWLPGYKWRNSMDVLSLYWLGEKLEVPKLRDEAIQKLWTQWIPKNGHRDGAEGLHHLSEIVLSQERWVPGFEDIGGRDP
ncbi:MAG: hypothetical protein M1834_007590 [Cirrosporium novae-zelandiae]|nr:MAG: hypothetical protein M1834_007590 [Cirrosporium novae-zelandiae]